MRCALLVTNQDVPNFVLEIIERVIHGHDSAARVAENSVDSLANERSHERLRSCYFFHNFVYFCKPRARFWAGSLVIFIALNNGPLISV